MTYGVLLGRFQPFHIGHEAIVHEIIADKLVPIILLGSANVYDERNPLTVEERIRAINKVFPNIIILTIPDSEDWNNWYNSVELNLRAFINDITDRDDVEELASPLDKEEIVWYTYNKEKDKKIFEFNGRIYSGCFYTQVFKELGYNIKQPTYPKLLNLEHIHASTIRNDIDGNRHYLDARVYHYVKGILNDRQDLSYYR